MSFESITNGILLSLAPYQEEPNHSILQVFTSNGKISMIAQGVNKPNSKNKSNLQVGGVIQFTYFKARLNGKMSKLKKANLQKQIDILDYNNALFVKKIILYLHHIEEKFYNAYRFYNELFDFISLNKNSYLMTFFVANTLISFGLQISIKGCVECKSINNICDFSFKEGGFLCDIHKINDKKIGLLKSHFYLFTNLANYIENTTPEENNQIYLELLKLLMNNGIFVDWEEFKKS